MKVIVKASDVCSVQLPTGHFLQRGCSVDIELDDLSILDPVKGMISYRIVDTAPAPAARMVAPKGSHVEAKVDAPAPAQVAEPEPVAVEPVKEEPVAETVEEAVDEPAVEESPVVEEVIEEPKTEEMTPEQVVEELSSPKKRGRKKN